MIFYTPLSKGDPLAAKSRLLSAHLFGKEWLGCIGQSTEIGHKKRASTSFFSLEVVQWHMEVAHGKVPFTGAFTTRSLTPRSKGGRLSSVFPLQICQVSQVVLQTLSFHELSKMMEREGR